MNINDFNYRETPVKKTRQYEVHTLSIEGFNQYLKKDSYLHNFLKSPNALYTKENNNELLYNNLQQENYLSPKNPYEEDEKFYHKKKDVILYNRETSRKFYPRNLSQSHNQTQNQTQSHNSNINNIINSRDHSKLIEEENNKSQYLQFENISGNFNSQQQKIEKEKEREKNEEQKNESENNQLYNQDRNGQGHNSPNQNQNLFHSQVQGKGKGKEMHFNDYLVKGSGNFDGKKKTSAILDAFRSDHSLKKFKPFLQTNNNFYVKSLGQTSRNNNIKNIAQTSFYNKDKYKENYYDSLNSLKGNLIFEGNYPTNKNITNKNLINSGNFKYNSIPHLNYTRSSDNFRINLIRNKLENTLLDNQIKEKYPKETLISSKKNEGFDEINLKLKRENDKLIKYMDIFNKNSEEKVKSHYPKLKDIMNSTCLRTTKMKLMNNKYMGERYNPANFQ
jgi:hypothetical protein